MIESLDDIKVDWTKLTDEDFQDSIKGSEKATLEDLNQVWRSKVEDKIKEKLGLSFQDMVEKLGPYVLKNCDKIADQMRNLAPYGQYDKLMEDKSQMLDFLKQELVKPEVWRLQEYTLDSKFKKMVVFKFKCSAIDQADSVFGNVLVSFSGAIRHAFITVDD